MTLALMWLAATVEEVQWTAAYSEAGGEVGRRVDVLAAWF